MIKSLFDIVLLVGCYCIAFSASSFSVVAFTVSYSTPTAREFHHAVTLPVWSSPTTATTTTTGVAKTMAFLPLHGKNKKHRNHRCDSTMTSLCAAQSSSSASSSTASMLVASSCHNSTDDVQGCTDRDLDAFLVQDIQKQFIEPSTSTTTTQQQSTVLSEINFARLLLIAAACLYGTNFSLVKLLGETDIPIGVSSTLRFGMAALATSPWLFRNNIVFRQQQQETKVVYDDNDSSLSNAITSSAAAADVPVGVAFGAALAGFEVGVWNSIGYVSQAVGLQTTAASKSAFLCSLAVVIVPILDFMVGKKLQPRQMIGAIMALAGVAFLELGGLDSSDLLSLSSGDIASLFQPLAFGMGFWRMERAMQKYPDQANRSTAAQLLAVFAGSAMYCAIAEPGAMNIASLQQWLTDPMILLSLFWTGVISTALTVYMETIALKSLSAAETTLILSTEPLWGAAFAAVIMGESLGLDAGIGAVLILAGCIFSNLGLAGIQDFLRGKQPSQVQVQQLQQVHEGDEAATGDNSPAAANSTWSPVQNVWRAGLALSLGAVFGNMWNDLSVGTKVLAFQLQELVEDITTFGPEP